MFCKKYKKRIAELEATVANLTTKCNDQDFEIKSSLELLKAKDKPIDALGKKVEELECGYRSQLQQNKNWEEKYLAYEEKMTGIVAEMDARDLSCNAQYTKVMHENIDLKEELEKLIASHNELRKENTDLHMRLGIASDQILGMETMTIKGLLKMPIDATLKPALVKILESNPAVEDLNEIRYFHVTSSGYKKQTWAKIQKLQEKYK